MIDGFIAWDNRTFQLINGTWHHPILDVLFPFITDAGHFTLPLSVLALTLVVWGDARIRRFVVLAIVAVVMADAISTHLFKYTFLRPRPCTVLPEVRLLVGCTGTPSFPSNHAVNISTLAMLVALSIRFLWLPAAAMALLVAYSRVYVGVHYPLDVLTGCLVGIAIALLLFYGIPSLRRRLQTRVTRVRLAASLRAQGS